MLCVPSLRIQFSFQLLNSAGITGLHSHSLDSRGWSIQLPKDIHSHSGLVKISAQEK
jgi:hypothetical protein